MGEIDTVMPLLDDEALRTAAPDLSKVWVDDKREPGINRCLYCDAVTGVPPAKGWGGDILIERKGPVKSYMLCPAHLHLRLAARVAVSGGVQLAFGDKP